MKKNLLDAGCCAAVISRMEKLNPGTQALWGSMTATEMLAHCNKVHEGLLSGATQPQSTSAKQYLLRFFVLYVLPGYPKGAKAPKRFITKGQISDAEFTDQKNAFIALMKRLAHHQAPIQLQHPYFGGLSTKQWGLSAYKHVDHHLRQFGV